jgi:anti-sigma factor RsiW
MANERPADQNIDASPTARPPATAPTADGPSASERELACIELVELVTDYLEGDVSTSERARIERHLAGCRGCTAYVEQMRRTISIAGALRPDDVPDAAIDPLLAIFRAARSDRSGDGAG